MPVTDGHANLPWEKLAQRVLEPKGFRNSGETVANLPALTSLTGNNIKITGYILVYDIYLLSHLSCSLTFVMQIIVTFCSGFCPVVVARKNPLRNENPHRGIIPQNEYPRLIYYTSNPNRGILTLKSRAWIFIS